MDVELRFTTKQNQKVNQNLIHMVGMLQMNRQELLRYLEEQSMENPLLEVDDSILQYLPSEKEADWMEQLEDTKKSFADELLGQLILEKMTAEETLTINNIIYNLDERGYFPEDPAAIAMRIQIGEETVRKCLSMIKELEPAGTGAFDLKECLLIQLERKQKKNRITESIVKNYLELLAKNHLTQIADKLDCKIEEVKEACAVIKTLNPRPANGWNVNGHLKYILPDFVVSLENGGIHIEFMDATKDIVRVQKMELDLEHADSKDLKYIKEKGKAAEKIVIMVKKRKDTLQKIMGKIVQRQEDFFWNGAKKIRALTMAEIANELEIHESTVSRAVNGKYFQCKWGERMKKSL